MKKSLLLVLCCGCLCSCVDVPVQEPARPVMRMRQAGIEPGAFEEQTLHFSVSAPSLELARAYARAAEEDYENIMAATGLYSFLPQSTYEIVVYADHDDYIAKTRQPAWSAGVTINNAIAVYDGDQSRLVLAHEMTHLVFNEFMGRARPDLRWLNEGLAVYMETTSVPSYTAQYRSAAQTTLRAGVMDVGVLTSYVPASQDEDPNRTVNAWYVQCESLTRYMIEQGGAFSFSVFLSRLKAGDAMDSAIQQAWRNKWSGLRAVDAAWKASL